MMMSAAPAALLEGVECSILHHPDDHHHCTKFGQLSGNSLKLLPPDATDAPNSIPGVCLSVRLLDGG